MYFSRIELSSQSSVRTPIQETPELDIKDLVKEVKEVKKDVKKILLTREEAEKISDKGEVYHTNSP